MIFGEHLTAPHTVESASWIAAACRGACGTVGALVPNYYPSEIVTFDRPLEIED